MNEQVCHLTIEESVSQSLVAVDCPCGFKMFVWRSSPEMAMKAARAQHDAKSPCQLLEDAILNVRDHGMKTKAMSERERQVKALTEILCEGIRTQWGGTVADLAECLVACGVRVPELESATEEYHEPNEATLKAFYEKWKEEQFPGAQSYVFDPTRYQKWIAQNVPPTLAGVPVKWIPPMQAAANAFDTQEAIDSARMEAFRNGSMDDEIRNQIVGTKLDTPAAMGICARCQLPTPENQLVDGRCGPCLEAINKE